MDLSLQVRNASVEANNYNRVTVTLDDVDLSEVLDHFSVDEVINHFGVDAILKEISIDDIKKNFDLVEPEF